MNNYAPLIPFKYGKSHISAAVSLHSGVLNLSYNITPAQLTIGQNPPNRTGELWEKNCLEFFCAQKGSSQYYEFNFSLEHEWNIYRFDSYRQGMQEVKITQIPKMRYIMSSDSVELKISLPWDTQFDKFQLSAVLNGPNGQEYYALAHGEDVADFHNRQLFSSNYLSL